MSYKIDLLSEAIPLKVEAVLRTQDDYNRFTQVLAKKWLEYITPSTTVFTGARCD